MSEPNGRFLIVGAGSHAHRVGEVIAASGGALVAYATTDNAPAQYEDETGSQPILRLDQALERFPDAAVAVAIGASEARGRIIDTIRRRGRSLPPIVHPQAIISASAELSEAVVILGGAIVEWRAAVGLGTIVDVHAVICHEARVGAMSHIRPGSIVGPRTQLPAGTQTRIGERIFEEHASRSGTV